MQIQINTDRNLKVHDSEAGQVRSMVEDALGRFADQITRLEIHLSDENAARRTQDDKRCLIEARQGGRKPIAVSHLAPTLVLAVSGAADKMARSLESETGRMRAGRRQGQAADPEEPATPAD